MIKNPIQENIIKLFDYDVADEKVNIYLEEILRIMDKICKDTKIKNFDLGDEKIGSVINISFINKRCKIHSNNLLECHDDNFELFNRIVKIYLVLENRFGFILQQVKRWE